jgi:hypothetical protein
MIRHNQRNVARPLIRHHIIQPIVGRCSIRPLIRQPTRATPGARPRPSLRQHRPLRRHSRRIPPVPPRQRNKTRTLIRHHIIQRIRRPRRISPLKAQPRRPRRSNRPCSTGRSSRPSRSLRPRRPRSPNPGRRSQRHIQHRRMPCQVILFAIELQHGRPRRQRHPVIRRRRANPSLHQPRHVHRNISPSLPHRHRLRRTPQRRQRSIRHAVLPPTPVHRLHAHRPGSIHPVAIQPQRRPRHLRRGSPRRQRRQIKLQQRRIPGAHIQIRDRPTIHRWPSAVHMSICHQRRLFRERRQSRGPQTRKPNPVQQNPPYQAHPTPHGQAPHALSRNQASHRFHDPNSAVHVEAS